MVILEKDEGEAFGIILEHFEVREYIGKGGFSRVFKVERENRFYAAKLLLNDIAANPKYRNCLEDEARRLEKVSGHPHIASFYDLIDGKVLLTEWAGDCDLSNLIQQNYYFTPDNIRKIRDSIGDALRYCHSKKVLHRDIKLSNIVDVIDPKLIDFGVTSEVELRRPTNTIIGSRGYFCKDLIATGKATEGSDYFALGVVLKQIIEGRIPEAKLAPVAAEEIAEILERFQHPQDIKDSVRFLTSSNPKLRWIGRL